MISNYDKIKDRSIELNAKENLIKDYVKEKTLKKYLF